LLATLAFALPALALVVKLPANPLFLGVLNNAAHAPVFGALAIVIHQLLPRYHGLIAWRSYAVAFVLAVATGGFIELIQPLIGRGAEFADLLNDGFGAIAGLALLHFLKSWNKLALLIAVAALTPTLWPVGDAAIAYSLRARFFPTLMGGHPWPDRYFIHTRSVNISRSELPSPWHRDGDPESFLVRVVGTRWPGLTIREPSSDWRTFSRLMIDITNPETRPLMLTLRVHDLAHNNDASDRFNRNLSLAASRRQTVAIPLDEIERAPAGRQLDLSRIAGVIIFGDGDPKSIGRQYYVTRIWLE